MQDITQYSDNELSRLVFNDEYLYWSRRKPFLKDIIDQSYIYTDEQWATLQQDLEDEYNDDDSLLRMQTIA
jgi:hypothetical protein